MTKIKSLFELPKYCIGKDAQDEFLLRVSELSRKGKTSFIGVDDKGEMRVFNGKNRDESLGVITKFGDIADFNFGGNIGKVRQALTYSDDEHEVPEFLTASEIIERRDEFLVQYYAGSKGAYLDDVDCQDFKDDILERVDAHLLHFHDHPNGTQML